MWLNSVGYFLRFALVVLIIAAATPPVGHAQTSSGSNRVLSPTTVAYWQQHTNGDGTVSVDFLLLWRGTPGWFIRGGSHAGGHAYGGFGQWQSTHWMNYGDITLSLDFVSQSKDFDPSTTVVRILDREIALRDANVVLVDGADSGMPVIVGMQYVEPRFSGKDAVAAIVRRSPELFDFLRCDLTLPDANQQAMMAFVCAQLRP